MPPTLGGFVVLYVFLSFHPLLFFRFLSGFSSFLSLTFVCTGRTLRERLIPIGVSPKMGAMILLSRGLNSTNPNVTDVGTNSDAILNFWLSLHISAGHILLPLLVLIFVFRTNRHPALINLCAATIVTSICACLLLYTGHTQGPEPPFTICLAQASLVSGAQPVLVTTTLVLAYQIWSSVFGPKRYKENLVWQSITSVLMLTLPWMTFATFVVAGAIIGFQHPSKVTRNRRFFYCSTDFKPFTTSISIFCAINLFIIMSLEFAIGYNIFRNWRAVKTGIYSGEVGFSMVIRVVCFAVYILIGAVLSLLSIQAPKSPVPDLWLASIGIFIVFVFGTQREVWRALEFWKPRDKSRVDLLV